MSSDSRKMQVMSRVLDLLKQLTQNLESDSQKIVSDLNDLAVKHIDIACDIAMVIERYFETLPSDLKLMILYLIDLIVVSVPQKDYSYRKIFSVSIVAIFCDVFQSADDTTRREMWNLRQSWNDVFDAVLLSELDKEVIKLDPTWLVQNDMNKEAYPNGLNQAEDDQSIVETKESDCSTLNRTMEQQLIETEPPNSASSNDDYSEKEDKDEDEDKEMTENDDQLDAEVEDEDALETEPLESLDLTTKTGIPEELPASLEEQEQEQGTVPASTVSVETIEAQIFITNNDNGDRDSGSDDNSTEERKVERSSRDENGRKRTKSFLAHVAQVMDGLSKKRRLRLERKIWDTMYEAENNY